ncbi:MAG: vWA domain-containing protein [Polyangiaceae bacterium]
MKKVGVLTASLGSLALALVAAQGCAQSADGSGFGKAPVDAAAEASVLDPSAPPPSDAAADDAGPVDPGPSFGSSDSGTGQGSTEFDLDAGCATAAASAKKFPVYMLFVVDGSGSMLGAKWDGIKGALDAVFDDMKAKADPALAAGMIVYADANDSTDGDGPYPTNLDVAPMFVDSIQHTRLRKRIDDTAPDGLTPTLQAMQGGFAAMRPFDVKNPPSPLLPDGKRVIVLVSDGQPTGDSNVQNDIISLVQRNAPPTSDILTFSIGVGAFGTGSGFDYDPAFMGQIAVAGGTRSKTTCNPTETTNINNVCHFQVTPGSKTAAQLKQEFIDALNRVRSVAAACEYELVAPSGAAIDPAKVNVLYKSGDGTEKLIKADADNGWSYDNPAAPQKVFIHGTACDTIKDDLAGEVKIVLGCKTAVN